MLSIVRGSGVGRGPGIGPELSDDVLLGLRIMILGTGRGFGGSSIEIRRLASEIADAAVFWSFFVGLPSGK